MLHEPADDVPATEVRLHCPPGQQHRAILRGQDASAGLGILVGDMAAGGTDTTKPVITRQLTLLQHLTTLDAKAGNHGRILS